LSQKGGIVIKHIVLWRLKEAAGGRSRTENAVAIKKALEDLQGTIPGLLRIEVGFDFSRTESSSDVALYCEFESREALNEYQEHPAHKAVMPLVLEARSERRLVDYEC
jgi:heme-degrading monooxygenase HmoA